MIAMRTRIRDSHNSAGRCFSTVHLQHDEEAGCVLGKVLRRFLGLVLCFIGSASNGKVI